MNPAGGKVVTRVSERDNGGGEKGCRCAELEVVGRIRVEGSSGQLEKSRGWGGWSGLHTHSCCSCNRGRERGCPRRVLRAPS